MTVLPYIVVIGGSYVGTNVAKQLASTLHDKFRILVVEQNSHFHHLFAFPRFAVTPAVDTHKAFIPYNPGTFAGCPPDSGTVVQARVIEINDSAVMLDREVRLGEQMSRILPFAFLVIATGTQLAAPSTLSVVGKAAGVTYLRDHANAIAKSSRIAVLGGGAVGVQMSLDIKELYPTKRVLLIHSRDRLMHQFHASLHNIISARCDALGVEVLLQKRAIIPDKGFPNDGTGFIIDLEDEMQVVADFVIKCTGQRPCSEILRSLSDKSIDDQGYIRVLKTLQIDDQRYPNVFALGDVAATGAHKAAKPANGQASTVVTNIQHLLAGEPLDEYSINEPRGIHLSLGLKYNVAFGDPSNAALEPFTKLRDDGSFDMNIDRVWTRKSGGTDFYA